MCFDFFGMVSDGVVLYIENKCQCESVVVDVSGKEYLYMLCEGEVNCNFVFIEYVVISYVQFFGMNFLYIMVLLMEEQQMMINCQCLLVIYELMEVEFICFDFFYLEVEFVGVIFDVDGKCGLVIFNFVFKDEG